MAALLIWVDVNVDPAHNDPTKVAEDIIAAAAANNDLEATVVARDAHWGPPTTDEFRQFIQAKRDKATVAKARNAVEAARRVKGMLHNHPRSQTVRLTRYEAEAVIAALLGNS